MLLETKTIIFFMTPAKKHYSKYTIFLSKLPIFADINTQDLEDLFSKVSVQQFQKGEVVTFNPNNHSNLYINYEGIFKINKIDKKGNEVVLQICDKKSIVSPMYFSPYYEITTDFIKKTTLLVFHKKDIDNLINKNHQFSCNIINFLAEQIQSMLLMIELLQLKNTKEKVGWYLSVCKIKHNCILPYPKALIANFLGSKPESFSRALKELSKEGIILENKTIKLEHGSELCQYCDKITGSECGSFLSKRCIHNE